jgi:hypothetical protein
MENKGMKVNIGISVMKIDYEDVYWTYAALHGVKLSLSLIS